ncbi:MAG: phosphoglucosamine mutase [Ignisphaera sp.]
MGITNIERKLFGTDGVRWIVDKEPVDLALRLAYAIASYFPPGSRALVGMDGRLGNAAIYGIVLSALASGGSKVHDAGLAPIPAIQLCVRDLGFDYGVMVTASHNPPEWVGIKVILSDGVESPPEVDKQIEDILFGSRFRRISWHDMRPIEKFDTVITYYVEAVKKHVDAEPIARKKLKVVIDCANSVSALTTPRILKELGVKALSINSDIGIPYRAYEPTLENLSELMEVVKAVKADFGIAHDGDGDRAIIIDEKGNFVAGDVSAVVLSNYISRKHPELPKRIVTAISTSHFLMEKNVVEKGIEVYWTKVGFINIARKIKELGGAIAGFEDNGGFAYVSHQLVRDGSMAAAIVSEMVSVEGRSISSLVEDIKKPVIIRTKVFVTNRDEALEIVNEIKSAYRGYKMVDIDGIKVITNNYAFLVRPSGTEPLVRITVESWDRGLAENILSELKTIIDKVRGVKIEV